MSTDGNSQIESIWNAMACAVGNTIDSYGWVFPALLMTILLLGVIVLIAWVVDDIPFDLLAFRNVGSIFRWARARWGPDQTNSPAE